ncbi:MAG: cation-translocating P-type ATPase C-terminal domain-containing protein, partial [archaeon]|nr:cation-translocating P-type ATPase C-terminal domain-containing protein [archaeon]
DSLGSLALATEPPYDELLDRPPTRKDESIINGKMWKHIILQSIVQLALLLVLYLLAPEFIKEDNLRRKAESAVLLQCYGELPGEKDDTNYIIYGTSGKWKSSVKLRRGYGELQCGKYSERQDMSVAFKAYCNAFGSTTHIGVVFNVFVIYTLFNEVNARVLDDSFNIFVRIQNNFWFPLITLLELALQVIIIQFSNMAFKCVEQGLTGKQWGITIGFSAITFVWSAIIKCIPLDICIQSLLDNSDKDKKVGNEEDLKNEKDMSDSNLYVNTGKAEYDSRAKRILKKVSSYGSSYVEGRIEGRSIGRGESNLRRNKPRVPMVAE